MLQANSTFYIVDKLKALSETLLEMSSLFQRSGGRQMFNQLQVSGWSLPPRARELLLGHVQDIRAAL